MILFVDTSALFALLVRHDAMHMHTKEEFARLAHQSVHLLRNMGSS
jgi:predicted nucleic acid-binding protein